MLQPSALRRQAAQALEGSVYHPKKLVLVHTAVAIGSFLVTTLLNYLLTLGSAGNGGLAGMELQAILATAQTLLELAVTVGLPFWNIGLVFAALSWAKGEYAGPAHLLQGFRRLPSVLGFLLLRAGVFLAVGFAVVNISSTVYMLTPFADSLVELLSPLMEQSDSVEALLTDAVIASLWKEMLPLLIVSGVLFALVAIPLFYRLRFSEFALMGGLTCGKALVKSLAVTRKRCLQIVRLDLSFWWYYLLLGLSILMGYGDVILAALGIGLPLSDTAASLMFYLLGLFCQGVLLWQYEARRLCAYGLAYRRLAGEDICSSPNEIL